MSSYLNQTLAQQHVAELISRAEHTRLRRELRRARRASSATVARTTGPGAGRHRVHWARRFGLAAVR